MINVINSAGSCKGINNALNLIYEIYEMEINKENPKRIVTYKNFNNNPKVLEELSSLGINTIDNIQELTQDDILIIGPKGCERDIYDYLNNIGLTYYDMTCPFIKKISESILDKTNEGYEIVLIGDNEEITKLNSYAKNNAILLDTIDKLNNINFNNKKKYIVLSEYAYLDEYTNILNEVKEKLENTTYLVSDNVCNRDLKIINDTLNTPSDYTFIIGSSKLDNILKNKINNNNVYNFSNMNEFKEFILKSKINQNDKINITGSTDIPIKELYNYKYLLKFLLFYKDKLQEFKDNENDINKRLINEDNHDIVKYLLKDFADLNQDGKYLRGTLIALGEYISGSKNDLYHNLAYAYEMFQTSILIHDDIIDNARYRRGKETIPRRICRQFLINKSDSTYRNNVLKLANSIAICIGDLGFYEANKLISESYSNLENLWQILQTFNEIVIKTIKGEILDVSLPFLEKYHYFKVKEEDVLNIYRLKTSYYTLVGPFQLGYLLSGSNIDSTLQDILINIGIAFQIKDDLLGIYSSTKTIGKSNTSDIEEFKQTILYTYIVNTPYQKEFLNIYGKNKITNNDLLKIRELLYKSGSYEYTLNYLNDLYNNTLELIDNSNLEEDYKDYLKVY